MSPFKHNIRNLRKAYREAAPERRQIIHVAALANNTCQINIKYPAALSGAEEKMRAVMKAAGVEPFTGKER